MTWIDERARERKQLEANRQLVFSQADKVFEALWNEIDICIEWAKENRLPVDTNGSPRDRLVLMTGKTERKELRLTLSKDRHSILVKGSPAITKLMIDVCDGRIVCLKHNDKKIDPPDAAILVLDRFLFPDLPAYSPKMESEQLSGDDEVSMADMRHDEEMQRNRE